MLYGLKKKETDELEMVDKILLRNILEAPVSSCVESLYLELGVIPIHILLKARRIVYFHYLVNLDTKEMLYKFFETQFKYASKDDWAITVRNALKDFGIPENFEFSKSKSVDSFKSLVKIKTKEYTMKYLLGLKADHTKMDNLVYSKLKMQGYLKSAEIPAHEAKNLFRYRVRSANFKENVGDKYTNKVCPLCTVHLDTQTHSMECFKVKEEISVEGKYNDIFKEKVPSNISKTLLKITKLRENVI